MSKPPLCKDVSRNGRICALYKDHYGDHKENHLRTSWPRDEWEALDFLFAEMVSQLAVTDHQYYKTSLELLLKIEYTVEQIRSRFESTVNTKMFSLHVVPEANYPYFTIEKKREKLDAASN